MLSKRVSVGVGEGEREPSVRSFVLERGLHPKRSHFQETHIKRGTFVNQIYWYSRIFIHHFNLPLLWHYFTWSPPNSTNKALIKRHSTWSPPNTANKAGTCVQRLVPWIVTVSPAYPCVPCSYKYTMERIRCLTPVTGKGRHGRQIPIFFWFGRWHFLNLQKHLSINDPEN